MENVDYDKANSYIIGNYKLIDNFIYMILISILIFI